MAWKTKENAWRGEARSKVLGKGLCDDDIRVIRALPGPLRLIAAQFRISVPMTSLIRSHKKWAHVKDTSE